MSVIQCQRLPGLEVFHLFHSRALGGFSAKTEKLDCLLLGVNLSLPSFGGWGMKSGAEQQCMPSSLGTQRCSSSVGGTGGYLGSCRLALNSSARWKRATGGCLCSLLGPAVPNGNIPFSHTVHHSSPASFKSNLGFKTKIWGFTHVRCSFWRTKMPKWSPAACFSLKKGWLRLVAHTWGLLNDASKYF